MNIKDYKKAFDGIRATSSLKKRVMDSAREADEERKRTSPPTAEPRRRVRLAPVFLGAVGAAAAFALILAGGGFLRSLFAEERVIVVTASEYPAFDDGFALAPGKGTVGALTSPKLSYSPDAYERMPAIEGLGSDRSSPFLGRFTTFGDELIEAVGREAFTEWKDHFLADPPYYTFYNNPNLLSYVTYFEIGEEKARRLLADRGGFNESELGAIAGRDESLCRRLFVSDGTPLVTHSEEGFVFYTMENLYEAPSDELAEVFAALGESADQPPEALRLLGEWANSLGGVYAAAVERKSLLVSAALFEKSRPSLPEDSVLHAFYDPAASDFSETLDFNGVRIYNYVLKLVQDRAPDEETLLYAIRGGVGEPNEYTIPCYRRLLTIEKLGITEEMLREALDMIDRHYYGQTGNVLYPDEALRSILYGTDEVELVSPYTLRSRENPVGTLWLSGADLYNMPVSGWFEFGDLSTEHLRRIEEALDGMQKEFFRQKIAYYQEIRLLTAEKLDGGAMAADEALIETPPLPEALLPALSAEHYDELGVSGAGIYNATLTELVQMRLDGNALFSAVHRMIVEHPELLDDAYRAPLLKKAYLYLWHTDDINLYCDEYLETLDRFTTTDYTVRTDGTTLYIGYGNADLPDGAKAAEIIAYAEKHHLLRTAAYSAYPSPEKTEAAAVQRFTDDSAFSLSVNPSPILPNAAERGIWGCAGFGYDPWLEQEHNGLDFAAAEGDEIAAIADGTVVSAAFEQNGLGNCVTLDHGNGVATIYAHCAAMYVKEGETVAAGEIIAAVGDTGYATGPHLHFELRKDDTPIDPLPYLNGEAVIDADPLPYRNEETAAAEAFEILPDQASAVKVRYGERLSAEDTMLCAGVVLTAKEGGAIAAIADGKIAAIQNDDLLGVTVSIEHGEGYELFSRYGSCADIRGKVGDPIRKGEVFAAVGEREQLYFGLDSGGAPFDPLPYLDGTESASEMIAATIREYEARRSGT